MQTLHDEIETHREPMRRVDLTGTYLKYLGSRADICELGQQLMTVRLQWKRLVQRAAQVKQQLHQAFHETKRVNMHTHTDVQEYTHTHSQAHHSLQLLEYTVAGSTLCCKTSRKKAMSMSVLIGGGVA